MTYHQELHAEWQKFELTGWLPSVSVVVRFWTLDGIIAHQAATVFAIEGTLFWRAFRPDGQIIRKGKGAQMAVVKAQASAALAQFSDMIHESPRRRRRGTVTSDYLFLITILWTLAFLIGDNACR